MTFSQEQGRRWPVGSPPFRDTHHTWVREPATGVYRLDVFRQPCDGDSWICLLFKAKGNRPKDQADFAGAVPLLDTSRRTWLREVLLHLYPGHRWLERI